MTADNAAKWKALTAAFKDDEIELDACDDVGRIDIQRYEDVDGMYATEPDFALWKKGERRLWLATYTFRVSRCEPVALKAELGVRDAR